MSTIHDANIEKDQIEFVVGQVAIRFIRGGCLLDLETQLALQKINDCLDLVRLVLKIECSLAAILLHSVHSSLVLLPKSLIDGQTEGKDRIKPFNVAWAGLPFPISAYAGDIAAVGAQNLTRLPCP